MPLSAPPPPEWVRYFIGSYTENPIFRLGNAPTPGVEGARILIAPLDSELEDSIKSIDERIGKANNFYESQVLPQKTAQAEAEQLAEEEERRRIEEARRQAEEL